MKSAYNNSVPVFEPNLKVAFQALKNWKLGFEYYGATGKLNHFENLPYQEHALFLTADLINKNAYELNFGPGMGLTGSTDKWVLKMYCGYRINWKKPVEMLEPDK